jgi:phage shock protein A
MRTLRDIFEKPFAVEQELESVKQELERVKQERDGLAEKLEQTRRLVDKLNARLVTLDALDRLDESST